MQFKRASTYIFAYLLWVVAILLGLLFMLVGANGIPQLLALKTGTGTLSIQLQSQFYLRMFFFIAGIGILVIIVAVESFFRHGAQSNTLRQRAARVFGPLILLVFLADLAQVVYIQMPFGLNFRWLLLGLELLVGFGLAYLGYRKPLPRMPRQTTTF